MRYLRLVVVIAGVLGGVAGCLPSEGSGDGSSNGSGVSCDPTFGPEDACGGDVSGTYNLQSVCSDVDWEAWAQEQCPEATVSGVTYSGTGTLSEIGRAHV